MITKSRTALLAPSLLSLAILSLASCSTDGGTAIETSNESEMAEAEPATGEAPQSFKKIRKFIKDKEIDKSLSTWRTRLPKPPKLPFGEESIKWQLDTTEGTMVFKLRPEVAPMHVSNIMYLTELGFYDDLIFHRVLPRFMAQTGCPMGTGMGNPGYKINGEFSKDAIHDRPGILSTANSGPNTDGSQFFITFVPYPSLDGTYSVFGEIVEGAEVLKKLEANAGTQANRGRPKKQMSINKATLSFE